VTDVDLGTIATVVGTDVAAISIIIVYHLFALQTWTQRGHELLDEAIQLSLVSTPEDLRREDLIRRARSLFEHFPRGQVTTLGVAVLGMSILGIMTIRYVATLRDWTMIAGPLIILSLTYMLSTVLIWLQGRRVLAETSMYLGKG
jgi:hypothetical protein